MGNSTTTGATLIYGTAGDHTSKEQVYYRMWMKAVRRPRDGNGRFVRKVLTNHMTTMRKTYEITNDNTK